MLWQMKNGETISISDMKDSHIHNCIAMLNRSREKHFRLVDTIFSVPLQGEMACDAQDQASNEVFETIKNIEWKIKDFEKELKRRSKRKATWPIIHHK